MAATAEQVEELRRMIAEPGTGTYSNETLAGYIQRFPRIDAFGRDPFRAAVTVPPSVEANPEAQFSYDLNAAASVLWAEKASALAGKFDFQTDGQSFNRSQLYKQAKEQARYYAARRSPSTITLTPSPLRNPSLDELRTEAIDV